tara:strand:+ start:1093 stop:1236 length:144 start_codon:yes stop_codon:yes gene_type:complete
LIWLILIMPNGLGYDFGLANPLGFSKFGIQPFLKLSFFWFVQWKAEL